MPLHISLTPADSYEQFQQFLRNVNSELVAWQTRLASQNVEWRVFTHMQERLTHALGRMDALAAVPGIAAYVKEVENDPGYDVAAEYQAMRASVVAIREWIFISLPRVNQNGTQYLAVQVLALDGSMADRSFTPAQTAGLRDLIDAFRATVA